MSRSKIKYFIEFELYLKYESINLYILLFKFYLSFQSFNKDNIQKKINFYQRL